jgi:hypothetical protein
MDASKLPKGKSLEKTSDGRPLNMPGVYKHRDNGALFTTAPGEEGVIQADALMAPVWKDAWERVSDVPSRTEILAAQKAQALKDAASEAAAKKAEKAELDAAVAGVK